MGLPLHQLTWLYVHQVNLNTSQSSMLSSIVFNYCCIVKVNWWVHHLQVVNLDSIIFTTNDMGVSQKKGT